MNHPIAHINEKNKLKAFVLGCDPTAFDINGKRLVLNKVFGIGQDGRYFAGIKGNLTQLNIRMNEIYVQNLITEYRDFESSKDINWIKSAQKFIPDRVIEFDKIDPSRKIPVFLTSELLYKALLNEGQILKKPANLYSQENDISIPAEINKLCRPLIPFYRHPAYSLKNQPDYKDRLIQQFKY